MAVVFDGNVHVQGTLSCNGASLPQACLRDEHWASGAGPLSADKQSHRIHVPYSQESESSASDEGRVVHIARAAGTLRMFGAGCVTPCGGAATVDFDLLRNGVSVLTTKVRCDSSKAARQVTLGAISSTSYNTGDVFEISIDATTGGGTLGKGAFCEAVFDENPLS